MRNSIINGYSVLTSFSLVASLLFANQASVAGPLTDLVNTRPSAPIKEKQDDFARDKSLVLELSTVDLTQLKRKSDDLYGLMMHDAIPLSLEECLQDGLRHNPSLLAVLDQVDSAALDMIAAKRTWNPTINLSSGGLPSFSLSQEYSPVDSPRRRQSTISQEFAGAISTELTWAFLDPTRSPRINSTVASYQAQFYLYITAARQLVFDIQQSYADLLSAQEVLSAYRQILESDQRALSAIEAKFGDGLLTLQDLSQVRSQFATDLQTYISYQNQYYQYSARLAELVARPRQKVILPASREQQLGPWGLNLRQTIDQGIAHNETILTSLEQSQSARWQGISLVNKMLPSLFASLNATYRSGDSYSRSYVPGPASSSSANGSFFSWRANGDASAYLGFNWLLFDGGVNSATSKAKFKQQDQFLNAATNQRLSVESSLRQNYSEYTSAKFRVLSAQSRLQDARLALDVSRERFRVGLSSITSLIQTTQEFNQAVIALATVKRDQAVALANLHRNAAIWPEAIPGDAVVRFGD